MHLIEFIRIFKCRAI